MPLAYLWRVVGLILLDTYKVTEALGDKLKLAIVQTYQQAIILEK